MQGLPPRFPGSTVILVLTVAIAVSFLSMASHAECNGPKPPSSIALPRYDESVSRVLLFAVFFLAAWPAKSATILVLRFHNTSQFPDLNWVGESVAETLMTEFGQTNEIVVDRENRAAAMKRMDLRPEANFTKATLIRLGQSLDADYVVYGAYDARLPSGGAQLKESQIEITARFLDLRKLHEGPEVSEQGKLADFSRYKEHLAWESLKYIDPASSPLLDRFMAPEKMTRLDAEESYIHGLLAADKDEQHKWFLQAANLDARFVSPAYELGRVYWEKKDYRQSIRWLQRVPAQDVRYPEARFRMGLDAYGAGDYNAAVNYFHEVANIVPLSEVYNNLAAAEDQLNQPAAIDDYRHALDGDPNDVTYIFNLGSALLRKNEFEEAAKRLEAVTTHTPDDSEAEDLLARAQDKEVNPPGTQPLAPIRLKSNFDATAFRQLKAMLQPKGKG